ncbi:MAG: hypothetical protein WC955_03840 [Elusimicrobiota bacterium]
MSKIVISGITLTYRDSVKELGPQIVDKLKELMVQQKQLSKKLNTAKKEFFINKSQTKALNVYLKDFFPELVTQDGSTTPAPTGDIQHPPAENTGK